jgi:hypothetical protein
MIRPLREDDDLTLVLDAWAKEWQGEDFGLTIDPVKVEADIQKVAADNKCLVLALVKDNAVVGIMGLVTLTSAIGPERIANEHCWYVMPEHRTWMRSFITYAKAWAQTMGCSHLMLNASYMASDRADRVGSLYQKMGLKPFENVFITEV